MDEEYFDRAPNMWLMFGVCVALGFVVICAAPFYWIWSELCHSKTCTPKRSVVPRRKWQNPGKSKNTESSAASPSLIVSPTVLNSKWSGKMLDGNWAKNSQN